MRKSLSLNSICRDSVSRVSSSNSPWAAAWDRPAAPAAAASEPSPSTPRNMRDLGLALGAFALFQHRRRARLDLDRLALGPLDLGIDLAHFLALFAHRAGLLPLGGLLFLLVEQRRQRQHASCPILSITTNQDMPGGQRDRRQQQRPAGTGCAPSAPKPTLSELPTSRPRMPPAWATSAAEQAQVQASRCRQSGSRPGRPGAAPDPDRARPSPSRSRPNIAIQAIAPSIIGSRKAM